MRIEIPQIFWHGNRDRIMSIDFYPNSNYLVTCGAEIEEKSYVKLWEITFSNQINILTSSNISNNNNINNINNNILSQQSNASNNNNNSNPITHQNIIQTEIYNYKDSNKTENYLHILPVFICDLIGAHTSTVNICRFSPNGMYLATGSDDSSIVIWTQRLRPISFGSTEEKIIWSNYKILRGHLSDVYDISWSPDSKYILSGSVDNSAIIFSIEKGKSVLRMNDHSNFVQGVSWDPRNKYIVTQSCDKTVRIYGNTNSKHDIKFYFINMLKRIEKKVFLNSNNNFLDQNNNKEKDILKNDEDINQNNNKNIQIEENKPAQSNININNNQNNNSTNYHYYFADEDQSSSFIRRNTFSPDGKICLLVAGININEENNNELEFCVWGMSRKDFSHPLFYIPTLDKSSTCCRFCPIIFEKPPKEENDNFPELIDIPYLMYFAIGTIDSLFIYGTNSIKPKYAITNIHYQSITDLAWNGDKMLAVSSGDGYISFCVFEEGELGKRIDVEKLSFDEKFMNSYKNYLEIDIKKNVMKSNLNNTVIVKPKRKNKNLENKEGNEINNNNINNMDIEKEKKGNEINNNNINNMIIDKEKKENEINNIDFDKEKKRNETNNNNINNMDIDKEKKEQN